MRGLGTRIGVIGVVLVAAACSSTPSPTPTPSATPTPSYADTITIGMIINNGGPSAAQLSNATAGGDDQGQFIDRFLYRGLYRYDEHFAPIPDLAAQPCDVTGDQLTVTCTLRDGTFSNGDPITADDVVFTYQIAASGACHWPFQFPCGNGPNLASVVATGAKQVTFRLNERDALFFTQTLPLTWILPKKSVMDAYDAFSAAATPTGAAAFAGASKAINDLFDKAGPNPPPDSACQALIARSEQLITRAGLELISRTMLADESGNLSPCDYIGDLRDIFLDAISDSLTAKGIDSVAAIYGALPLQRHPVGSGLWTVTDYQPANRIALDAAPGASPATRHFVFRFFKDRRQALDAEIAGQVDWVAIPGFQGTFQGTADLVRSARQEPKLQLIHFPVAGAYTSLQYNVQKGQLMADPRIREAVERCIDKPAIVEAATDGVAAPAWSFVPPGSWAAAADLPQLPRDVAYGRSTIELAGWSIGSDGYYQKGGRRLGIEVLVGAGNAQRERFLELAALQLRDCGFDLTVQPENSGDLFGALASLSQTLPDGHHFEAAIFSSTGPPDPGLMCDFDSTQILTSDGSGRGCNAGGYVNASLDRDMVAARNTYDLTARAQYYKDAQQLLASDHAALFAWFNTEYDVLAPGISTTQGPIDPAAGAGWDQRLESLVKIAGR